MIPAAIDSAAPTGRRAAPRPGRPLLDLNLLLVFEAMLLHHGAQSSGKRWSPADQIRVRLRAGFNFETEVLPRWRLAANQLANYAVVTVQITGRKLLGIQHPELQVIKEMHREHLKRALSSNNHH